MSRPRLRNPIILTFLALGSWLALPTSAQEDVLVVTVAKPQPLGEGPKDEMIERLSRALVDQLDSELRAALGHGKYQVRQESDIEQGSTTSPSESDQTGYRHYRLSVLYQKKESGQYEIFSDLFEGGERARLTATIHRLCPSGSGIIQCNLSEIASFHMPYILRGRKPRPKQFFLKLDLETHGGTGSSEDQQAQAARGQKALEREFKSLLIKKDWNPVPDECYADYIFHFEALAVDQDLQLKVTITDVNNGNLPLRNVYEPGDSEPLEDLINLKSGRAEQWVNRFAVWLTRQLIK